MFTKCELTFTTDHMENVIGLEERHRQGAVEGQGMQRLELAEAVSGLREQRRGWDEG